MLKLFWWISLIVNIVLFVVSYGYKQFDLFVVAVIALLLLGMIGVYFKRLS